MGWPNFSKIFSWLNPKKEKFINILLLGETGVGKSTLINAFANYLVCQDFKRAEKKKLLELIPTKVTIDGKTYTIGTQDSNEYEEIGSSATQGVKTYVFPIVSDKIKLRLIDTPGLADTRGIEQDEANCEMILDHISTLDELHAFCLVMRPDNTRITAQFEYCIKQILTRLEKSAAQNIIFVITNAGTGFNGGETMPCLKKFVDGIAKSPPFVKIPLEQHRNVFCFENDCFHYLALQNQLRVSKDGKKRKDIAVSWQKSSEQCRRLIEYISGGIQHGSLKPHKVQDTVSVNEARRLIIQLSQPLADITQTISDNIDILLKHEEKLKTESQSLDELKGNLYIPGIQLETTEIDKPITVCTTIECAEIIKIESKEKWHYRQKCHEPCYLQNVPKEIIGDPALRQCAAMNGQANCKECGCHFSDHMHVYYLTKPTNGKIVDQNMVDAISTKETALQQVENVVKEMRKRKRELETEHETIVNITAKFVHFLQHNAITPFDDSYKTYIQYLIKRQEGRRKGCDLKEVANLKSLLQRHEAAKAAFDKTLAEIQGKGGNRTLVQYPITAKIVLDSIQILFNLKHNGAKIKEIYDKQKNCRQTEYGGMNLVYEHPTVIKGDEQAESVKGRNRKRSVDVSEDSSGGESEDSESGQKGGDTFILFNF